MKNISLSVGELTEIGRRGDINFRFSSRSSAQEGIAAHRLLQRTRGDEYIAEKALAFDITSGELDITIKGRVDGYFLNDGELIVDEIKSIRIAPEEIPPDVLDNFWRQAFFYGYMLSVEHQVDEVTVRLCLYHLDEKKEYQLTRLVSARELAQMFVDALMGLVHRVERRLQWQSRRRDANSDLRFPYGDYRPGQRDMAVSVYRALRNERQLVMQAPTGIGKTMGTIFPAVHALETEGVERLFYLSAKTPTQKLAEDSVRDIGLAGGRLKAVTLTAKEKICFSKGQPCDPDHCKFAAGYYDRIEGAIDDTLQSADLLTRDVIEEAAHEYAVCPFEFGLDLSRSCDLVICDYNYVFDPVVYLRRFFDDERKDSLVLVDEAHNLVDRGREMFSAEIDKSQFLDLSKSLKEAGLSLHRSAMAVNRAFLEYRKQDQGFEQNGFMTGKEPPQNVLGALQQFTGEAEEILRLDGQEPWREALLETYFAALRFVRTAEEYGDDYVTLLKQGQRKREMRLKLYCVDPSNRLGERFAGLAGSVCFSATMQPRQYFSRMLGVEEESSWYRLPSPFPAENLHVCVAGFIETTYKARQESIEPIIAVIREVVAAREGNYIVFFPSYQYLNLVFEAFTQQFPDIEVQVQNRAMSDEEREGFLAGFESGPVCGFAVMGGAFAEGVDLKGTRLIGAIIVGVGLPQLGVDRDLIRDYFGESGFEFAYQYPGITRVLQTAGRVIRTDTDEGVICLIDSRYLQNRYRSMLPDSWQVSNASSVAELGLKIEEFWCDR